MGFTMIFLLCSIGVFIDPGSPLIRHQNDVSNLIRKKLWGRKHWATKLPIFSLAQNPMKVASNFVCGHPDLRTDLISKIGCKLRSLDPYITWKLLIFDTLQFLETFLAR